jgi:hypothetical protein
VTTIELLPVQWQLNLLSKKETNTSGFRKNPHLAASTGEKPGLTGADRCMLQHQRMLSDLLVETCDELNRRAVEESLLPRRNDQRNLRRRENSPIRKGKEGGARIETLRALSSHLDRLRLFPHILWKSCATFGSLSRRFDESREKIEQFAVEKRGRKNAIAATADFL